MRNAFVDTLYDFAKCNKDIMLITGDLGYGVLTKFWENYPNQFVNAGICEQNMTSVAAGMAIEGKVVFTYSIANFTTLRCLEQIRNDVAYHNANVKIVSVGGGFAYGALGMSHHATEDIAILRALPNMTVFTPCDPIETREVTKLAVEIDGPCYIRLGKGKEKNLHTTNVKVSIGKGIKLREGKDVAILVAGAIANEAVEAADILKTIGIGCEVYSFPTVKPIDSNLILSVANKFENIYTLEEHNIIGGFGSAVSEVIAENKTKAIVKRIGLKDVYTSIVGDQSYLREYYKMNSIAIIDLIKEDVVK
jgi:transketolase